MSKASKELSDFEEVTKSCIYCGYCGVCPTYKELKWESYHPRSKLKLLEMYLNDKNNANLSKSLFDAVFACSMCSACEAVCPVELPLVRVWEAVREESFKRGRWSTKLIELYNKVKDSHNIYGLKPENGLIPSKYQNEKMEEKIGKKAKYLLFLGCKFSYSEQMEKTVDNIFQVLNHLDEDYSLLGPEERCCGFPIIVGGGYSVAKSLALHNYERIKETGADTIIAPCAEGYRVLKKVYPIILGEIWDFTVLHITEYIEMKIKNGDLLLTNTIREKLTYKDPCELVRHCNVKESPRNIIKSIPKIRYEELTSNREDALCCGGGGLLETSDPKLAIKVNERLMNQVEFSEADILVCSCPTCLNSLQEGVKRRGLNIEVVDLIEIVLKAMEDYK